MKKQAYLVFLIIIFLFSLCVGCASTVIETPTTSPQTNTLHMCYDDYTPLSSLGGSNNSSVQISDQVVTSRQVCTDSPDANVLYYDSANHRLIATGTGTAKLIIDDTEYHVEVSAAPISLFMITGHSLGAGQKGDASQSIECAPGQTYSSTSFIAQPGMNTNAGIGYGSAKKILFINSFSPNGGGTAGEGSALAYRWNQLTGEKVWVINVAVGGSCINEWIQGQNNYNTAVSAYRYAATVISNEVKAGHYVYKNSAVLYHSAANFSYKNVVYTNEILEGWYRSLCEGLKNDLATDIDGDGSNETIDGIGFIPLWDATNDGHYDTDMPATYYMAASDQYPGLFIASEAMRAWAENFDTFPKDTYTTQSKDVQTPNSVKDILSSDGVHYNQVGYNGAGIVLADNLYKYLRTDVKADSICLQTSQGTVIQDNSVFGPVGSTKSLVILSDPCYAGDYTINVSDHFELSYPFVLKAVKSGSATISILKDGTAVKTIHVMIAD